MRAAKAGKAELARRSTVLYLNWIASPIGGELPPGSKPPFAFGKRLIGEVRKSA